MKKKNLLQRKEYGQLEEEGRSRKKGMKSRLKEHIDQKKETINVPIPDKPVPIHQNFVTFTGIKKKWKGKGKNKKVRGPVKPSEKEPYFGKARKFPRTENEIIKDRLKTYNEGTQGKPNQCFLNRKKVKLSKQISTQCLAQGIIRPLRCGRGRRRGG